MFGGLKDIAVNKALGLFEEDLRTRLTEKIELFRNLKPSDVADDGKYAAVIIEPLWLYVKLQSGVALATIQKVVDVDVESRFKKGLFHVRDELIKTDGEKVTLDPQFLEKVGPTVVAAFKG